MTEVSLDARRVQLALACRMLAQGELAENVLGHVSMRIDDRQALVRCRGPEEKGLLFTRPSDIRVVDLDEGATDDERYHAPKELPIHSAVLGTRPDVEVVIHAHPPRVIAADLAGIPLVPMFGAYDIPAARLAAGGIPVHPRGVLITRPELAAEMVDAMGRHPVCVLRGHGIVTTGTTVEEAVTRAFALDTLARMGLAVAGAGGTVTALPAEDLAELPDLGTDFNDHLMWRHRRALLARQGLDI